MFSLTQSHVESDSIRGVPRGSQAEHWSRSTVGAPVNPHHNDHLRRAEASPQVGCLLSLPPPASLSLFPSSLSLSSPLAQHDFAIYSSRYNKTVDWGEVTELKSRAAADCGYLPRPSSPWSVNSSGKARSGTEYGPLTDLADWSYTGAYRTFQTLILLFLTPPPP